MKVMNYLKGKKTYILAIITAVYNLAVASGWIAPEHVQQINIILGTGIAAAIRDALKSNK